MENNKFLFSKLKFHFIPATCAYAGCNICFNYHVFHGHLESGNTKIDTSRWCGCGRHSEIRETFKKPTGQVDPQRLKLQRFGTNPPSCADTLRNQLNHDKLRHIISYSPVLISSFLEILSKVVYQAAVKMLPFFQILPYTHCQKTTVFLITVIV